VIASKDYDTAVGLVRAEVFVLVNMRKKAKDVVVIASQYTRMMGIQNAFVAFFKTKDRKFNEAQFRADCTSQEFQPTAAKASKNVRLVEVVANDDAVPQSKAS
jgi:hypothetical protein